jgi:hypothetical protein
MTAAIGLQFDAASASIPGAQGVGLIPGAVFGAASSGLSAFAYAARGSSMVAGGNPSGAKMEALRYDLFGMGTLGIAKLGTKGFE